MHFDEYHHHRILDFSQNKLAAGADMAQAAAASDGTSSLLALEVWRRPDKHLLLPRSVTGDLKNSKKEN